MSTSMDNLKNRLRSFLADPQAEQDFRVWFTHVLREASAGNDPELETLAHAIQRAFSDTAAGLYTPGDLRQILSYLAGPAVAQTAPVQSEARWVVFVSLPKHLHSK